MSPEHSFDPAAVVEWALTSLRDSTSTGVALGEEHQLLVANERARILLGIADIPPEGIDWVGMTPPEYRSADDLAIADACQYGASRWFQKEFVIASGERVGVELLVLGLQTQPFRWLALLRSAGSSPLPRPVAAQSTRTARTVTDTLRLARRLAGAGTLDDVLRIVDRLSTGALGAQHVSVALLDDDRSQLLVHHDPMAAPGATRRRSTLPVDDTSLIGDAARRDQIDLVEVATYSRRYPGYSGDADAMALEQLAAVPMHDQAGELVGVLAVGWADVAERDVEHLESVADLIGDATRLARDTDRNRAMAATFQEMLLPTRLDPIDPAVVGTRYQAVDNSVGGDFYDVVNRGEDSTWMLIGDVVGHGIRASRTMGKIRFFLRSLLLDATDPASVLDSLNQLILAEGQDEMATCLLALWNRRHHSVTYASAGHLPQLIVREQDVELLPVDPDPPIGVRRVRPAKAPQQIDVRNGLTLVYYTDGLVERRGRSIDESLEFLCGTVRQWLPLELEVMLDRLLDMAADGLDDDIALLAVQLPAAGESLDDRRATNTA